MGDISDADSEVYDLPAPRWEGAGTAEQLHKVATDTGQKVAFARRNKLLAETELA